MMLIESIINGTAVENKPPVSELFISFFFQKNSRHDVKSGTHLASEKKVLSSSASAASGPKRLSQVANSEQVGN